MKQATKVNRTNKPKKYISLTLGELEKLYGYKYNAPPYWKLTTYFEKTGIPSLSKALKKLEEQIAK